VETLLRSEDCNCFAVRSALGTLDSFYDQFLAPIGLHTTQFSILAKLKRRGPLTIHALAKGMVIDRTTLGRNILPLERNGLIRIQLVASDRRAKELQLTKAGESASRRRSRAGPRRRHDSKARTGPSARRTCTACCGQSWQANSRHDRKGADRRRVDGDVQRSPAATAWIVIWTSGGD
jgi:DNA-binding MarR family transcriptional regulator